MIHKNLILTYPGRIDPITGIQESLQIGCMSPPPKKSGWFWPTLIGLFVGLWI